jgi:hypothetical protein
MDAVVPRRGRRRRSVRDGGERVKLISMTVAVAICEKIGGKSWEFDLMIETYDRLSNVSIKAVCEGWSI